MVLGNAGSTVTVIATDTAQVTIEDDDAAVVTIDPLLIRVNESDGNAVITAELDNLVDASLTVSIATGDGTSPTATAGTDYTVPVTVPANTLTFAANTRTANITVPITDDTIVESTETFTVTVSNPGGTLASDVTVDSGADEATVEIIDDDAATLTIADVEVDESARALWMSQFSSANPLPVEFTVEIATADGYSRWTRGRIAGEDYTVPS